MHYYQFHIADYRKDTAHLTPIEHYIYRTLIDWYFLDEKPIPDVATILRRLGLSNDCSTDVQRVLNDFFIPFNETWKHSRIERDIQVYHRLQKSASMAGKASAAARKANKHANLERPLNDRITEPQPTNNHKPITNNQTTTVAHDEIVFDGSSFKSLNGYLLEWQSAYPAVDIQIELNKAAAWLVANPKNIKKNYARFLNNWLAKAQDRSPAKCGGSGYRPKGLVL